MANGHRDEALKALRHVIESLESPEPIEGLKRFQIRATVEYAESEVKLIQELQRVRKSKEPSDG